MGTSARDDDLNSYITTARRWLLWFATRPEYRYNLLYFEGRARKPVSLCDVFSTARALYTRYVVYRRITLATIGFLEFLDALNFDGGPVIRYLKSTRKFG